MSQVGLEYKQPRLFKVGPVRFYPGVNWLKQEDWDLIKDHPKLDALFKSGEFAFVAGGEPKESGVDEPAKGDNGEFQNPLEGMSASEAKEAVLKTLDITLLEQLKAVETRKTVLDAIEKQIEKLMPTDDEKAAAKSK